MAANKAETLLTFAYEGTDKRGQKIKGETTGKNIALAKTQLRKQGINVVKIHKKSAGLFSSGPAERRSLPWTSPFSRASWRR